MTEIWMKIGVGLGVIAIVYVLGYIRGNQDAHEQANKGTGHDAS